MAYRYNPFTGNLDIVAFTSGAVVGPASATDDALVRFDGTTGKLVQNSVGILSDAGALSGLTQLDVDNIRVDGNTISSTDVNGNVTITPNGTGNVTLTPLTGILSSNGASGVSGRTLTQPAAGIIITNADGTAGNPTFALANDLAAVEGLATAGLATRTAADTWTTSSIVGTTDFIDVATADGVLGDPTISIATNFKATGKSGWNGAIIETVDGDVASDGATITYSVEKSGGGNLTVVFSDGYYNWNTTPAATVTLTAGSDTSPTLNYVYLLQSTKTLTASTAGWPATEHAPLATVLCQSAASLQTDLAYKDHAWTDHIVKQNEMGHIADINFWIRQQSATYVSGLAQTYNINSVTNPDEVTIATSSGVALQLHDHDIPAFAASDDYYVINDSVTPYLKITDLNAIDADSTGATLVGRYYSLVMWIAVSEDAGECKRFINLPSGSYNNQAGVESDSNNFANYTIPNSFVGAAVLVSEWKLRQQAADGGTFTSIDEIDLRGLTPSLTAGGGGSSSTEFADNTFRIFDDVDVTKKIAFQASGITTATTRELTVQDADGTIAYTNVAGGGTGNTSFTDGGILLGSGTGAVTVTAQPTNGQLLIGSNGADPVLGSITSSDSSITMNPGAGSISLSVATKTKMTVDVRGGSVENLGFDYAEGTGVFTILSADGTDLSSTNQGYVVIQDIGDPGELKRYEITANQSFIDDVGASEIIGNLFGLTTSVATANDIPFFIYAVTNDAQDAIAFMIGRVPGSIVSPGIADIGAPDDPVADKQWSLFSLENIDETLYDSNPCIMIGGFRMRMSASNDWTVQSLLTAQDGVGAFQTHRWWLGQPGQFGAATGSFFRPNGGTAPIFTNQSYFYKIYPFEQMVYVAIEFLNVSTEGVGAVTAKLVSPFEIPNGAASNIPNSQSQGVFRDDSASSARNYVSIEGGGADIANFYLQGGTSPMQNQDFDTNDDIFINTMIPIRVNALV